jgi:hypothetical protein
MIDMINILVVDDTVALKTTVKKECEGEVQTVPKWMGVFRVQVQTWICEGEVVVVRVGT